MSFHFWTLQNNQMLQSASLLPLWKQMLTSERFLHLFCQSETTWCLCIVLESLSFSEETKLHWTQHTVTLHSNTSQPLYQQQMTTQVLLHHHTDDEFCTNCRSYGVQGVTDNSITLQWKYPSAERYGSLPMVVEKCPLEQIIWDIFLATETFLFYIQFLQNSIQYTTNNFPNTTRLTGWLFLPNLVAAQLWNSPNLLSKNYSWLLPQQQILWNSHSIETDNLWSLNVMAVQRVFTFYPRTQYDLNQ